MTSDSENILFIILYFTKYSVREIKFVSGKTNMFQPEADVDVGEVLRGAIPLLEDLSNVRLRSSLYKIVCTYLKHNYITIKYLCFP